jgi:hypothetical protein
VSTTDAVVAAAVGHRRALGADLASIDRFLAARPARVEEAFHVHPDNHLVVRLMLAMQTQWEQTPLSTMSKAILVRTRLIYDGIEQIARLSGLGEISPADFRRVQLFEATALAAWAEARG